MEKVKKELITIFWVFIIGSIFGCVVETALEILVDKHFHIRQGLIYGPFIPVYGVGAVMYYFIVTQIKDTVKVFLSSMALGGMVEYVCSYVQEIFFGTISWDYSNMAFNLNGRTSLMHCIFWGLAGIFYVVIAYPIIVKWVSNYNKLEFKVITTIMMVFMLFNITISCAAGSRQNERVKGIVADSKLDKFLDYYYPDSKMDRIYSNKIVTVTRKKKNDCQMPQNVLK